MNDASAGLSETLEALRAAAEETRLRMLALLAETSRTAHLVQMVDSTIVRAHVSAAGAKGGTRARRSAVRAADFPPRST